MKKIREVGDCPKCGDSLILYSGNTGSRFVLCNNKECNLSYPIPHSGIVEATGAVCPQLNLPVLFVNRPSHKSKYCWVREPCFACRKASSCREYQELVDEYDITGPEYLGKKKQAVEEISED